MDALAVVGDEIVELGRLAGRGRDAVPGLEGSWVRARPRPREEPVMNQVCVHASSTTPFSY